MSSASVPRLRGTATEWISTKTKTALSVTGSAFQPAAVSSAAISSRYPEVHAVPPTATRVRPARCSSRCRARRSVASRSASICASGTGFAPCLKGSERGQDLVAVLFAQLGQDRLE